MASGRKQGWFESDDAYRDRIRREADEGRINRTTGNEPSQGWLESDEDYNNRISREADEGTVEKSTGSRPGQGWFESDSDYEERIERESHERTVEDVSGNAPSQGWFESDDDYRRRVEQEADEATIERATGDRPSQGWFESDSDYQQRVSQEADEHDSDAKNSSSCFLTTACTEAAGLRDDCHELTTLRRFRDYYVRRLPDGPEMIEEYYRSAPVIVSRIQESLDRNSILESILGDVRRAVIAVEAEQPERALTIYQDLFARMYMRFSNKSE
jgi:hypothetical protein